MPTSLPQWAAVTSEADVLGYGGAAGGGKSDLLLGLAATQHKQSVVLRRVFPNLRALIERSREILNPQSLENVKDSFNEGLHRWTLSGGRMIEFEACQHEKDKEKQRGRPRDFYGFDEATEFTRTQFEFITAWLRTTSPGQRCRVVLTFNPPTSIDGMWIIDYFAPWLDEKHPNPALPGELRWYTTIDGEETEVESGEPFYHNGEKLIPKSRTFIPAGLNDNPYLGDDYRATLQSLPEPLRSQLLYGDFSTSIQDDPWQVIPTAWVRQAQERWAKDGARGRKLIKIGCDPSRGGKDEFVNAFNFSGWFDIKAHQASEAPDGRSGARLIINDSIGYDLDGVTLSVDVVGIGSSVYDFSREVFGNKAHALNAGSSSDKTDKSGVLEASNVRAAYYWEMREVLDPESGDNIAIPPDPQLLGDLTAATYEVRGNKIVIEPKEKIKHRLQRSPDRGEALMFSNYSGDASIQPAAADPVNISDSIKIQRGKQQWQKRKLTRHR